MNSDRPALIVRSAGGAAWAVWPLAGGEAVRLVPLAPLGASFELSSQAFSLFLAFNGLRAEGAAARAATPAPSGSAG